MSAKVLIIMGSSRSDGNTRKIVDAILAKTDAELIDLNAYKISYFDYQHRNKSDDFVEIATKMMTYDVSPSKSPVFAAAWRKQQNNVSKVEFNRSIKL